jgi:tetratricopeptide (TPR) repeat protein
MLDRSSWLLLLVLGAATGAGGGALVLWLAAPAAAGAPPAPSTLPAPEATPSVEVDALRTGLEGLVARVDDLEGRLSRRSVQPAPADVAARPAATEERPPAPDADADAGAEAQLRAMLGAVLGHGPRSADPEEEERFWELARTSGALKQLLAELEAEVASDPDDVDARLELAQAYVAKLLTVPGGPERGLWGARAEEQWREAARIDPRSWEARFALGENYSYYPPFLNKSGEALTWLEAARELQEQRPPEPRFVETYVLLARLYQERGAAAEARAALESGLVQHPRAPELLAALDALDD